MCICTVIRGSALSAKFSEDDINNLALAIAKALQQARSVSDSEHYDHHKWITGKMKAEERRAEFWGKMIEHSAKMGMWSVITAFGYACWLWIKQHMGWK